MSTFRFTSGSIVIAEMNIATIEMNIATSAKIIIVAEITAMALIVKASFHTYLVDLWLTLEHVLSRPSSSSTYFHLVMPQAESLSRRVFLFRETQFDWLAWLFIVWIGFLSTGATHAAMPDTQSATSLHAKYLSLGKRLQHNSFGRALALDSYEASNDLKGDVYALVNYPFPTVSSALSKPEHWCDVLILHINTKYCHATTNDGNTVMMVSIGKKTHQPVEDAYPIEFLYRAATATPKYMEIQLSAEEGPLNTRNYLIQLQAIPVGNSRTFLHLTYSYAYGPAGRLAMQTYLATIGSGKVGFTITGRQTDGQPEYIGGMRGLMERNAMRYYLAIGAYLGALSTPSSAQLQKRLQSWFTGTEQYPRQLHEVDRIAYINMKRIEYRHQQTLR